MLKVFVICLALQAYQSQQSTFVMATKTLLDVVYWEVKPYIFTNKKGEIDGIIPQMLKEAEYYCIKDNNTRLANYALKLESRKSFYELSRSNSSYGKGILKNVSSEKAFWVPAIAHKDKKSKEMLTKMSLKTFRLISNKEIAVIVPRSYISLPNKLLKGILSCQQILTLSFLLSAIFGITLWFIERLFDDQSNSSFIKGSATCLWWSFVSMTTVGYGDIVPRSFPGRVIGVIWMFTGVMIACVLTATVADVVSGTDLQLTGKDVAVLENTYEEKVAANGYAARVIPAESYERVLGMVRNEEVYAAMINSDIAAWYQDEITNGTADNPLEIVDILPGNLYVDCYVAAHISHRLKNVFKCMYQQKEEVYVSSAENFQRYCKKQALYIGTLTEFFADNKFLQGLLWIVSFQCLFGMFYEIYCYFQKKKKANKHSISDDEKVTLKERQF